MPRERVLARVDAVRYPESVLGDSGGHMSDARLTVRVSCANPQDLEQVIALASKEGRFNVVVETVASDLMAVLAREPQQTAMSVDEPTESW